jgi:ribosomal-protein-alanine N-acetyltransferase
MASNIRWFEHGRDYDLLTAIDAHSFEEYWTKDDFKREIKKQSVVCRLAEDAGATRGFVLYELYLHRIHIIRIGVHPKYRKQGIGSALLADVAGRLSEDRNLLAAEVRESNLPLQLFLSSEGYNAVEVMRNYYADTGEDCFVFHYRLTTS